MANKQTQAAQGLPEKPALKEVFSILLTDTIGRTLGAVETDGFPTDDQIRDAVADMRELHGLQVFAKVDKRYTI